VLGVGQGEQKKKSIGEAITGEVGGVAEAGGGMK